MTEEFSLSLGKTFMRTIAERILEKFIHKALGGDATIRFDHLDAWSEGDKLVISTTADVRCEIKTDDIFKLLKGDKE